MLQCTFDKLKNKYLPGLQALIDKTAYVITMDTKGNDLLTKVCIDSIRIQKESVIVSYIAILGHDGINCDPPSRTDISTIWLSRTEAIKNFNQQLEARKK